MPQRRLRRCSVCSDITSFSIRRQSRPDSGGMAEIGRAPCREREEVLVAPVPYGDTEVVAVIWSSWKGFPQTWLSYDEYDFFFQAEDGIRDADVTGVQTCALPI